MLDESALQNAKVYPIIPIRDGVIFPNTEMVLTFGRPKSLAAIEESNNTERMVVLAMQKNPKVNQPEPSHLYSVATLGRIKRLLKTNGEINALIHGVERVEIISYESNDPFFRGKVVELPDEEVQTDEITALIKHISTNLKKAVNLGKAIDFLSFMNIMSDLPPAEFANHVASILNVKPAEKQLLLETRNIRDRLVKIADNLTHEVKILEIERNIASKTQKKFDRSVKETVLRERLKTIEKELGRSGESKESREYLDKIKKAKMPREVEQKARKELKKLAQMSTYNPEASYIRAYLDWLVEIPWSVYTSSNASIAKAKKILDEDHYGLSKVKERILEYLAVMRLKQQIGKKSDKSNKSGKSDDSDKKKEEDELRRKAVAPTILCFVGPPGVGKTSIGRSIARALGRKFVKMSLGGMRDEAEIRGHRRTYVGALPGRIVQGIKQAGTKNPVFMLDEIDKVGKDFRGDPSAALLEALDPEQNHAFSDHYLELPFDLSDVMFITTCNILDTIPPALKDRLEIIRFPGYTEYDKFQIAKRFLIDKQIEAHGLKRKQVDITDQAIHVIIRRYTREAGVRNLEREIASIFRKVARKVVEGKKKKEKIITSKLQDFLGPAKFTEYLAEKKNEVGMATGLAWTQAGGDILFIEVALMRGKGNLLLTGHLGEVMKESCKAALSYVRSRAKRLELPEHFYSDLDVHVHVPEGAVPKDGPSAGIAITTALVSALMGIPAKKDVAMTGEVTLRGRVLEIGGVKEKIIAAHRAKIKTVIIPTNNKKDLDDIRKRILRDLKFVFVDHMDQVLKVALEKPIIKKKDVKKDQKEEIEPRRIARPLTAKLPS